MTLKIIHVIYRNEIPLKNINLKGFRAEQFCQGNLFIIFFSNPRAYIDK